MNIYQRKALLDTLILFDLLVMVGAFVLATCYTVRVTGGVTLVTFWSMRVKLTNFVLFAVWLLAWHILFSGFGLYNSRRMAGYGADAIDTILASAAGTAVLATTSLTLHIRMVTFSFLLIFWVVATTVYLSSRLLLRYVLHRIRLKGRNLRDMLIVGTNSRALDFAKEVQSTPEIGYRIVGFVDQTWAGIGRLNGSGLSVVSDFAGLPRLLRNSVVDEIVVALPMRSLHTTAAQIVALCEEQGVTTRILPDIFDLKLGRVRIEDVGGIAVMTTYTGAVQGWPIIAKRGADIFLSAVLLVGLGPLLLAVAVLIRLTSPGAALFTQDRLGLNKRRFKIYKFRTMTTDAEQKIKTLEHLNDVSGPVFKMKNDPRITKAGKVLRKMSIDELPQLFNVLKGDMSLVGPRPLPVRDYEGFNEDWQRRRFSVRPGITCLWQINGRSSLPFEKWMQLDLQYIDKWSLWLDVKILFKTIPAVLKGAGAA